MTTALFMTETGRLQMPSGSEIFYDKWQSDPVYSTAGGVRRSRIITYGVNGELNAAANDPDVMALIDRILTMNQKSDYMPNSPRSVVDMFYYPEMHHSCVGLPVGQQPEFEAAPPSRPRFPGPDSARSPAPADRAAPARTQSCVCSAATSPWFGPATRTASAPDRPGWR